MLTEHGLHADADAVDEVLRRADVLAVGFTLFPQRLLVDLRSGGDTGPLATIVEPVGSVQERYLWLGRNRGMFGAPRDFSYFTWPHTVRTLVSDDVLARLRERLAASSPAAAAEFDAVLRTLATMERDAMRAAVRGAEGWQTLWEREAA